MTAPNPVTSGDETRPPPSSARRRFLSGVVTGGLLASRLAGGASVSVHAHPGRGGWFGAGRGAVDPTIVGERAAFATDGILRRIDAREAQRHQVQVIVQTAVQDLWPLRDQHRQCRQALRAALTRPTIHRVTLGEIRRAELHPADAASSRLVAAIADAAEVLTPEQRATLADLAARGHRSGRRR
jgi:protein CpxP